MEERPSASQTMDKQMWLLAPTLRAPGTALIPPPRHPGEVPTLTVTSVSNRQ